MKKMAQNETHPKCEYSKKAHSDEGIPATPDVDKHNSERLAEKYKINESCNHLIIGI